MQLKDILALPLNGNSSIKKSTVGDFLSILLTKVLEEQESFNGKRPWGNSGWYCDLRKPLIEAGLISGTIDEDGYINDYDENEAMKFIIEQIIKPLFKLPYDSMQ